MRRLIGLTILLMVVAPATARAQLEESSPAAEAVLEEGPQRIDLRFTVETTFP